MNIISVSNVQQHKSASNVHYIKLLRRFCAIQFSQISRLVAKPPRLSLSRRGFDRLLSVAVIRAANSKGTGFGSSPFFFSSLLSSGWPVDLDRGGGQRVRGWYFFYVPLVFHARSVISPVNFTKLAPTAISLRPLHPAVANTPANLSLSHCPVVLFFYSRFPATYARRFFLSCVPAIYLADRSSESWP